MLKVTGGNVELDAALYQIWAKQARSFEKTEQITTNQ
jgi:hypothetical protein